MIRLAFTLFKYAVFATIVLILGQWLTWNGKTLSDHVRTQMAHPQLEPLKRFKPTSELQQLIVEPAGVLKQPSALKPELHPPARKQALDAIDHPDREELEKVLQD